MTTSEGTQLKKVQENKKLDNSLTYHRWMVGMECRKDILNENDVINKKIRNRVTPFRTRFESQIKTNKMRLVYFVGFCVVFSMGKIYDMVILENSYIRQLNRNISSLFVPKTNIITQVQNNNKIISNLNEQKKKAFYDLFIGLDRKVDLNQNFINRIARDRKYEKQYVDLGSFVEFFQEEELEAIKSKIKGQFPSLNMQI